MTQGDFAQELKQKAAALQKKVESSFYYLEADELNAKPNENTWSILQCMEHINLTNEYYLKGLAKAIELKGDENFSNSDYSMGLWGKFMTNAMQPKGSKIRWKMKTFDRLVPINQKDPKARLVEQVVFEKFNEDMKALTEALDIASEINWKKVKINTLLGKSVKLRLGDALAFVLAHTERHIQQAINLKNSIPH